MSGRKAQGGEAYTKSTAVPVGPQGAERLFPSRSCPVLRAGVRCRAHLRRPTVFRPAPENSARGRDFPMGALCLKRERNKAMPPAQRSPAPAIPSFDTTARQRRDGVGLRERVRSTRSHGACSRNAVRRAFPQPAVIRNGNAFPSLPRFPAERRPPGRVPAHATSSETAENRKERCSRLQSATKKRPRAGGKTPRREGLRPAH